MGKNQKRSRQSLHSSIWQIAMLVEGNFKGWDVGDRDYLIDGLLNVFLQFTDNSRLHSFTCSVDLSAYERLKKIRQLPSPEKICARIVFPKMIDWYAEFPDPILDVIDGFFDRSEKFLRHVYRDWESPAIRKRFPFWHLVRTIAPVAMETTPPMQMADVVAWGRNRLLAYRHHEKPWEVDPHYATAVRATSTLRGTWTEVNENALANILFKDEGYDAIDPQRRDYLAKRDSKSYQFERLVQKMLKAPPNIRKEKL